MVNLTPHGLDRDRQYFGFVDGLRALAMLALAGYELVRLLPQAGLRPELLRASQSGANALALFFVISGFVLAHPALNQLRHKRRFDLDPTVYAFKRAARVLPTYLTVLALLVLVPLASRYYGVNALAGPVPPLESLLRQAVFAGDGLGNDGMWTLGVTVRLYLLFPLLLVLWTRSRLAFVGLALLAAGADALTPAHGWALGALVPFMLGIVAADALVSEHWLGKFAFVFAVAAAITGFVVDPFLALLPGPAGAPVPFPENPFWAIAFAALVLCAGRARLFEQALEFAPLRLLGKMSYAISLTVVPAVTFTVRQLATSPAPSIALSGFASTLVCGFALWQIVDRWFADPKPRSRAGRALGSFLDRGGRSPRKRVHVLADGDPPKPITRSTVVSLRQLPEGPKALLECTADEGAPLVTMRSGLQSDLAAEILEVRHRLAEHAATRFADEVAARQPREQLGSPVARIEREPAGAAAEPAAAAAIERAATASEAADPLAAALGHGVKILVLSRNKPK
jgi:peptidoglycan/LPS O-acetylase OafA/YrhL